ncbi:hypothetical protein Tco_0987671 [Tanacetum coccineum]
MSSITAQQTKLDLDLVPKEKRLEIGKCNGRLNLGKKQRKPTFQVVMDAHSLTPCYSVFLTTADVSEVYMHQFWDSIHKYENPTGVTPPKKARKFKKPASPKLTTVPVSPEEPTRKSKRVKRPAKKFTNVPTGGVVIRETHVMSLSKKEKMIYSIQVVSVLLHTCSKSAKIKPFVTNKGTGAKPGVPGMTEEETTESEAESWGRDKDDSNNDRDSRSEGSDQESDSGDDNT